jgi:RNA recognition motif-containing protein
LSNIFGRFGDLNKIILSQDMKFAYVFFSTFHSAFIAAKLLNGLEFLGKMAKLNITWTDHSDYDYLLPNFALYLNSINWQLMYKYCSGIREEEFIQQSQNLNNQKQNKLTCRYDIQIQN